MKLTTALSAAMLTCAASVAGAQSLDLGVTTDYDTGGAGLVAEYHGAPAFSSGNWSGAWGAAGRADADGDAWFGAGFALNYDLSETLFVEASFMPGYYVEGDTVLGGNLHFRSLLGLGWNVSDRSAMILSIDHLSNGGLDDVNPGSEAIALRYRLRF